MLETIEIEDSSGIDFQFIRSYGWMYMMEFRNHNQEFIKNVLL